MSISMRRSRLVSVSKGLLVVLIGVALWLMGFSFLTMAQDESEQEPTMIDVLVAIGNLDISQADQTAILNDIQRDVDDDTINIREALALIEALKDLLQNKDVAPERARELLQTVKELLREGVDPARIAAAIRKHLAEGDDLEDIRERAREIAEEDRERQREEEERARRDGDETEEDTNGDEETDEQRNQDRSRDNESENEEDEQQDESRDRNNDRDNDEQNNENNDQESDQDQEENTDSEEDDGRERDR